MTSIEAETTDSGHDRQLLEALVIDNPNLERLEALLDQFNIFEAVGAVRQELRHSDFLAFLLNPQQNHGLGDAFVKKLLQKTLLSAHDAPMPITPIDLDIWDLNQIVVFREWQNIDILALDELHQLAIIVENKINSSEHAGQLERYRQIVARYYPGWKIIGIYLTPDGETPSDETYLPVDYGFVSELMDQLIESRASTLGADVRTLMVHYVQMLRRHIVSQSEIAELCQRLYRKHQRALDLIYEYRPDRQAEISDLLKSLIEQTPDLQLDHCSKGYIRFCLKTWDVSFLMTGKGWTRSGRILLFEFTNATDSLKLKLLIGPGPDETRQRLFDMARNKPSPFSATSKSLNVKWNTIFVRSFLASKSYEDTGIDELATEIRKHWVKFVENDLPSIETALRAEQWIWEGVAKP